MLSLERHLSKLDRIQLMQKIIHLQSELTRYKQLVEKYQNNYHYKQVDELKGQLMEAQEKLGKNAEGIQELMELKEVKTLLLEENDTLLKENTMLQEKTSELEKKIQQLETENLDLKKVKEQQASALKEKAFNSAKPKYLLEKDDDSPDSWFLRSIRAQKNEE
ncbi:MAG: hypothetical protein LRY71_00160 [Bacillaceae bacterium]|nr:hypothetical protein [Bacillaceae bacterium]